MHPFTHAESAATAPAPGLLPPLNPGPPNPVARRTKEERFSRVVVLGQQEGGQEEDVLVLRGGLLGGQPVSPYGHQRATQAV